MEVKILLFKLKLFRFCISLCNMFLDLYRFMNISHEFYSSDLHYIDSLRARVKRTENKHRARMNY